MAAVGAVAFPIDLVATEFGSEAAIPYSR